MIVLSAILVWLENVGYDITTLLAGLGVGGVAIALALQKPLEDVFGAVSLYTQQPVRIGTFARSATKPARSRRSACARRDCGRWRIPCWSSRTRSCRRSRSTTTRRGA
ncbi:MAG: mechanosensitive ion channel family protein [Gammaproteobacteria bacterium]|nr:mechanosensitive ion channel family protein [Gammaproteobacteria bacterium]MBT8443694.1 mechanosensitive ion channel family protein [Gammaproteobacteria bacterium]